MPRKFKPQTELRKSDLPTSIANMGRLEKADPRQILQRYLTDESTSEIAASYGVTRQGLGFFLLKNAEADWKECQVARAIARKEKAEDVIENATDPLELARGRELLKSAQWDLERVCRRIYGQEINMNVNISTDLGDRLRRARERAAVIIEQPKEMNEVAREVAPISHAHSDGKQAILDAGLADGLTRKAM